MLLEDAGFDQISIAARGNPLTVACYKVMSLELGLLAKAGGGKPPRWQVLRCGVGLALLPALLLITVIANLSLYSDRGNDCLGYTVTARRGGLP